MILTAALLGLSMPAFATRNIISMNCDWGNGDPFLVIFMDNPDEIQFDRSSYAGNEPMLEISAETGGEVTDVESESGLWVISGSGQAVGRRYTLRLEYKPTGKYDGDWTLAGTEDGKPFGGKCARTMLVTTPRQ